MESLSIVIVSSEVMWRLEVSDDNQTWTLADNRSTNQPVTYYRRRIASFGSPEAGDGRYFHYVPLQYGMHQDFQQLFS